LQASKSLPEKNHSQQNIDQGVDKVSKASLENMFIVDGPDVNEPVESEKHGGKQQNQNSPWFFYNRRQFIPVSMKYKYDKKKEK